MEKKDDWRKLLTDTTIEVDTSRKGPDIYVDYMKPKSAPERLANQLLRDKEFTNEAVGLARELFNFFLGGRK